MNNEVTQVSVVTIVNEAQELIEQVKADKKIELKEKVKLITTLMDRQLRGGALTLVYQRNMGRLPEGSVGAVLQLNASPSEPAAPTKQ